jgi:hypothetical protein
MLSQKIPFPSLKNVKVVFLVWG